jgi:PAS domain S-box-containing protein
MRTSQEIAVEIEEKIGFFPPFFAPALETPQVLENLWQQTLSAYLDNPLPSLFKEKLSAYLSRFCPVPYCLVCHSCSLRELGMRAQEILIFLETAPPSRQDVEEHLRLLSAQQGLLEIVSQLNSVLEESLLDCSIFIALNADETSGCRRELRRLLGTENYQYLVTFIAYVKTCHEWMEAHPEVEYESDYRAEAHFKELIAEEPKLADFYNSYWDKMSHEQFGWSRHRHRRGALPPIEPSTLPFARALDSAAEGIVLTDPHQPDNPIIYANPAFATLTGYQPTDIIGLNCRFLQGSETDQQIVTQIRDAVAQQQPIQATLLNYRKQGQPFWNELKVAPVRSDTGELLYFVGIQTDVTEREQMQEQLRLLHQSQDAILVLDLENRVLFWNESATRLFGWSADEAIGSYIDELLFNEFSPQLRDAQTSILDRGMWSGELEHRRKDGQKITVDSRWTLIRQQAQHPQSILVVSTNITERKQTEFQRQRAQRFESISTVASGMAHNLNNALAPILMTIQLLADKLPDEQSRQLLATLEKNTMRSAEIVQQVVSFVQGIQGDRNTLSVHQLLSTLERVVKQGLPRNILLRSTIASDLWTVVGDRVQLQQMLISLCENARDAMPEGGILRLSADNIQIDQALARTNTDAKVGSYVVITIADTGVGIPPEQLNRIFEPFFTTKELGQGTGLGLSMVVAIVKGHGGFVNVQSELDQGTQLRVYLPAQPPRCANGEVILLVEDNRELREMAGRSLEQSGYRVLVAQNGIDAIAQFTQHRAEVSAVFIHLSSSELDTVTTIRALQRIHSQVVILAIAQSELRDGLDAESRETVKAWLTEPYTAETLIASLRDVLLSDAS